MCLREERIVTLWTIERVQRTAQIDSIRSACLMEKDKIALIKKRRSLVHHMILAQRCRLRGGRRPERNVSRDSIHRGIEMGEIGLCIRRSGIRIAVKEGIGKLCALDLRHSGKADPVPRIIERITIPLKRLFPQRLSPLRHDLRPIGMKFSIHHRGDLIRRIGITVFRDEKITARQHGAEQSEHRKTETPLHITPLT